MTHRSNRTSLCVLTACVGALFAVVGSAGVPDKPSDTPSVTIYTLDTPPTKELADALRDLLGVDECKRKAAATALATLDDAEPFLRHYRSTKEGKADVLAGEVLNTLSERRAKRNLERVPGWAKEGRYDLLVDASLHLTTTEQADKVGQSFFDFAEAIRPIPPKIDGPKGPHYLDGAMKVFAMKQGLRRFHQQSGVVETDWISHGFVRAKSCEASARTRFNWLILTQDQLKGTNPRSNQWENCYIFHNSDITLDSCVWSLVVCDGDVEFVNSVDGHASTIIANGSIRSKGHLKFDGSSFFAKGDITAPKGSNAGIGLLLAGGKIDVPRLGNSKESKERVEKAGVKENPFAVRFFETTDLGVELETKENTVSIAKLTPTSPLLKHGIKVGDVLTQLNERMIVTAQDLRRELRYSVVLEAGIFHIRRGDAKLTRIVYFKDGLVK